MRFDGSRRQKVSPSGKPPQAAAGGLRRSACGGAFATLAAFSSIAALKGCTSGDTKLGFGEPTKVTKHQKNIVFSARQVSFRSDQKARFSSDFGTAKRFPSREPPQGACGALRHRGSASRTAGFAFRNLSPPINLYTQPCYPQACCAPKSCSDSHRMLKIGYNIFVNAGVPA